VETKRQPLETQPVTSLRGVGPRLAERLARLGLATVLDLLFHLPLRYQDRSRRRPLGSLLPGEEALIEGEVGEARISYGQRRTLKVWLADESGTLQLRFFHFGRTQTAAFTPGARLRCFGEVRAGVPSLEMIHPEFQLLTGAAEEAQEDGLTPIYPTTEGLQQASLRNLIAQALALLESDQAAGGWGRGNCCPPRSWTPCCCRAWWRLCASCTIHPWRHWGWT
jgi:ATP-dependent DNA helicase RecG